MHHPRLHSRALLVGVVLNILALAVHCKTSQQDPMLAEESSPAYSTGVRYSNEAPMLFPKNYFQLVKRSASSPLLSQMSHREASPVSMFPQGSMSFLTKPVPTTSLDSSESGEVYKKSASEYWGNEVAAGGHGDSLEDQSSYGGGHGGYGLPQQSHGGYMPSHGGMGYTKGKEIAIRPDHKPITLHYRTHAQPIMVHQTRIPGPKPQVKHTTSHDEPHRVYHEVLRPIIQEVHEIIQPYRRVIQRVEPVIEEIKTVVAKDAGKGGMSAQGGYASGGAGGGQGSYGGSSGLAYAPAESAQMYQRKAVAKYEASPSEEYGSMALPTGMTLRRSEVRSKVFLKNGVPVYQSNYMGPALTRS